MTGRIFFVLRFLGGICFFINFARVLCGYQTVFARTANMSNVRIHDSYTHFADMCSLRQCRHYRLLTRSTLLPQT